MSNTVSSQRVTFIVLRFMRKPILALVSVYAISMVGWVLIPGVTVDGKSQELSFFHAFYFLTYTATTTGFGEIPITFSNAQRMWSIVSLYSGVLAWLYAVGSIIQLLQILIFVRRSPSGALRSRWRAFESRSSSSVASGIRVACLRGDSVMPA